jgi:hypothetical protein
MKERKSKVGGGERKRKKERRIKDLRRGRGDGKKGRKKKGKKEGKNTKRGI